MVLKKRDLGGLVSGVSVEKGFLGKQKYGNMGSTELVGEKTSHVISDFT